MEKENILLKIKEEKLIAVVRAEEERQGIRIIESIVRGGINLIEITMTVPGAVDIIKELTKKYKGTDVVIGAGTVLDSETARIVILAGAEFVVSPCFNNETIRLCNRYRIPVIPGIMTVTEAVTAMESGCDILKVFPGNAYSPSIIKSFKGPLPQAQFMPTGGVSVENVHEWLKAGAVAVGTGSNLTEGAARGDYPAITSMSKAFVEAVHQASDNTESKSNSIIDIKL